MYRRKGFSILELNIHSVEGFINGHGGVNDNRNRKAQSISLSYFVLQRYVSTA